MKIAIKHFNDLSTKELHQILKIRSEIFVVEQDCVYLDIDDVDLESHHLIGYVEKEIAGYLRIYEKDGSVRIGRVLVADTHRRKGHASKIMEGAIDFIQTNKPKGSIKISAQEHLKSFYGSFQFEQTSDMYLEDGMPHIGMVKTF
jgi:ElaA protein